VNKSQDSESLRTIEQVVEEHGPWTAMSIHLGGGRYTREPAVDGRLPRLVQVAADLVGKPLSECRVLDLACLEGHYALEFGLHGAEVVGIEIREINLAKAEYARKALGLDNVRFVQDDVRNLSEDKYGRFDIVLCYGILYHLDAPAVLEFVHNIHDVCDRLAVFESYVSIKDEAGVEFRGRRYWGRYYREHDEDASAKTKERDLFASIDNVRSFWLTLPSLLNLLTDSGFSTVYDALVPRYPAQMADRPTLIAVKGAAHEVMSSPITADFDLGHQPENHKAEFHPAQIEHGWAHRTAKRVLPQPVKDAIKPLLRAAGLLHADSMPQGLKEYHDHQRRER